MSTIPDIRNAIEISRTAPDFSALEERGILTLNGTFSADARSAWQEVATAPPPPFAFIIRDSSGDEDIRPSEIGRDERVSISLTFDPIDNVEFVLSEEGWRSFLCDAQRVSRSCSIYLLFVDSGFETYAFAVKPWTDFPVALETTAMEPSTSPRRLVRSISPDFMAPNHIEPWIMKSAASTQNPAQSMWQEAAAKQIAISLVNELFLKDGVEWVQLSGSPMRRLECGSFADGTVANEALQRAAKWVFLEGNDAEVRHTFLTVELSREWPPNTDYLIGLPNRLSGAIESAELVYRAHLQAASRDTLNSLADLRKTLSDDVENLVQQSRDLSTAVWRDVAITLGIMAIRFAGFAKSVDQDGHLYAAIYFSVILYVLTSYGITRKMHKEFIAVIENSRATWRNKLYAYLDDSDYRSLAQQPIEEATRAYGATARRTGLVLTALCLFLAAAIAFEMDWIAWNTLLAYLPGGENQSITCEALRDMEGATVRIWNRLFGAC